MDGQRRLSFDDWIDARMSVAKAIKFICASVIFTVAHKWTCRHIIIYFRLFVRLVCISSNGKFMSRPVQTFYCSFLDRRRSFVQLSEIMSMCVRPFMLLASSLLSRCMYECLCRYCRMSWFHFCANCNNNIIKWPKLDRAIDGRCCFSWMKKQTDKRDCTGISRMKCKK